MPNQPQSANHSLVVGLNAAIIAIRDLTPVILEVDLGSRALSGKNTGLGQCHEAASQAFERQSQQIKRLGALPFGPFDPIKHRTLEGGLRAWVEQQTNLKLGHVEQLYTFGDRGRAHDVNGHEEGQPYSHEVSIGYLALTHQPQHEGPLEDGTFADDQQAALWALGARWRSWYSHFPWEDWRNGRPALLDEAILPALSAWAETDNQQLVRGANRSDRITLAFGLIDGPWDEERVLERYELLYEAGLVAEYFSDKNEALPKDGPLFGHAMHMDHRRILATAISRLRGKLKYRPVVFELMPATFTLTQLQSTVEAISGRHLHKQNFRRLVEQGQLVEPTGASSTATGGRPAALFRFRRSVLAERPASGLRLGSS